MSGYPTSAISPPVETAQQCCDDIERLTGLPAAWKGRDPTSIAESLLETLLEMLELDFVGLRFSETTHIFLRIRPAFAERQGPDAIVSALNAWLESHPQHEPTTLLIGCDQLSVMPFSLGDISSMGILVAGTARREFPEQKERLKLSIASTCFTLACREVRELSDRQPPADFRAEKPTGEALAESEWRLNLIISTIPAMAWSSTADGMMDFVNQHFLDFVGLTLEELAGLGFYRIFHPDDTAHLLLAWQDIMASKRGKEVEGRIRRGDGEYRWFTLRQNPLLDAEGNVVKWYGVVLDIEDRKRAERALQETKAALLASEQNLNLIVNSLPVLVWSARPDGSADFINESWLDYAGVPAEEILGWGFLDLYHPDDIPGMVEIWKKDLEHSDRTVLKGRIRRRDGEYRWFFFAGRKLTDANGQVRWFGCNTDIEDLQRAEDALRESEAALRESERRLKALINTLPAFICSATPDGNVDFFNEHFLEFGGYQFEDMQGQGFYRVFHPEDVERLADAWENIVATKRPQEVDGRLRRADGEYRWFTLRQGPLFDHEGNVIKWHVVVFDIEDRKRAEEELRRSQSDLFHVTRMMTTGELAVSIAHEINQPLMAIVANAGTCLRWLEDGHLNVEQARLAAERVVRDGHRAGDIIAGIRSLARKSPAQMEDMDLQQAIREVLELLRGELKQRSVDARLEASQDSLIVFGDRTQLQQVILNLVMNGAEAMAEMIRESRRLAIHCARTGDGFAQVSVSDTGRGLNSDVRERMFDAFFTTKGEGVGMGLAICRSIVEAHEGRIWASDNQPQGSILSFTVPLATDARRDDRQR